MNWTNRKYSEGSSLSYLDRNKDEIQDMLNRGMGLSKISQALGVNYSVFAAFVAEEGLIPWPELSEMDRCTFVDFVKGRIKWDGKTRLVTKQQEAPQVLMSAPDYVRFHFLLQELIAACEGDSENAQHFQGIQERIEEAHTEALKSAGTEAGTFPFKWIDEKE